MKPAGQRVVVAGLGASGFAAARALLDLDAKVRVTEGATSLLLKERAAVLKAAGAEVVLGETEFDSLDGDLAVVSPGIPPYAPVVGALAERGIEVISEIELAYRLARCDFIAVTGTNGKTTTTSLLAAMLEESSLKSVAAGNIGLPLVEAALAFGPGGVIAAEVSSFQLATITSFRPRVAVLLNIAEDHTDWHGSFEAYVDAKARIVEFQEPEDTFVVNASDEAALTVADRAPSRVVRFDADALPPDGIGYGRGRLVWRGREVIDERELTLMGPAGRADVAAAAGAALEYGVSIDAVARAVRGFRPLGHRLELVAEVDGVRYVNDSKATNPHATLAAVEGLTNVVLIAGGRSKGIDLSVLRNSVPPVSAVVGMGEASDAVAAAFEGLVPVDRAADMPEAVSKARARAIAGGSVLLSPGCASLDMYENYAQRGDAFAASVRNLLRARRSEDTADGDE